MHLAIGIPTQAVDPTLFYIYSLEVIFPFFLFCCPTLPVSSTPCFLPYSPCSYDSTIGPCYSSLCPLKNSIITEAPLDCSTREQMPPLQRCTGRPVTWVASESLITGFHKTDLRVPGFKFSPAHMHTKFTSLTFMFYCTQIVRNMAVEVTDARALADLLLRIN